MQQEPALSIIITTHNRPKHLKALLARLLPFAGQFELIVASDGEVVPTELLAPFMETLTYIQIPVTGGPATGRNIGLDRSRGRYVLFCDDDDLLEPEWVRFLLNPSLANGRLYHSNYRILRGESYDLANTEFMKSVGMNAYTSRHLQVTNNIPIGSFAVSREETRNTRFLQRLQTHEDWDYLLQVGLILEIDHVEMNGVSIFIRSNSDSNQKTRNYKSIDMHPFDYLALYRLNPASDSGVAKARSALLAKYGLKVPPAAL